MPALDAISADYAEEVTFLAVAGRSTLAATEARAPELMPSGRILWGMDEELAVWELFGVRNQPSTVLITSRGEIVDTWFGELGHDETRTRIEDLIDAEGR